VIGAMVVISRAQVPTSHNTVVGFLREAGRTIGRVRVRLSDASGTAVEDKSWFNDSTDAAELAEEVAHHIGRSAAAGLIWMLPSPFRMKGSAISRRCDRLRSRAIVQ
jgi:hypothetical protein